MGTNPVVDDPRGYGVAYAGFDPFAALGGSGKLFGDPNSPYNVTPDAIETAADNAAAAAVAGGASPFQAYIDAGNAAIKAGADNTRAAASAYRATVVKAGQSAAAIQAGIDAARGVGSIPWVPIGVGAGLLVLLLVLHK